MKVPDGPSQHHPATPARMVLAQHVSLHDRMSRPSPAMIRYIHAFGRDGARKAQREYDRHYGISAEELAGMMWFPWRVDTSLEAAAGWCSAVGKSLFQAQTFQVTAEMVDVVTALYENASGLFHMELPELPAPHGFCWFDKPLVVTDRWGRFVVERAFSWELTSMNVAYPGIAWTDGFGRPLRSQQVTVQAVRLATWNYAGDAGLDDDMREHPEEAAQLYRNCGDLSLSHTLVVPFGERHKYDRGKIPHPDGMPGDYQPDSTMAWIHALWMVMEQEVVVTRKPLVDRAALRRTLRSIKQGEVSVVLLRRSRSHAGAPEDSQLRNIDWSCRWLVQGHHRHLGSYTGAHHHAQPGLYVDGEAYCAICWERDEAVRVTWIKSHIKGPEDRPLKATEKIYKLAR